MGLNEIWYVQSRKSSFVYKKASLFNNYLGPF